MFILAFSGSVLLISMGAWHVKHGTNMLKEGVELLILAPQSACIAIIFR